MYLSYNTQRNVFSIFRDSDSHDKSWVRFGYDSLGQLEYMFDDVSENDLFIMLAVGEFVNECLATNTMNVGKSDLADSPIMEWFTCASNHISSLMDAMARVKSSKIDNSWVIKYNNTSGTSDRSPSMADICAYVIMAVGHHSDRRATNKLFNIMSKLLHGNLQNDEDIILENTHFCDKIFIVKGIDIHDDKLTVEDIWHEYEGYMGCDDEDYFVKISAHNYYKLIVDNEVKVDVGETFTFTLKIEEY